MANNFSVEDALSSRKKRKEEERSLSVDKALADRKQRITSSIDSISSDINSRLNDSVRKYTDYENNYSSGNNSTMSDVLNNQRVQNVANQKAMQKVNAYRNYLDESAVNEALKRLGAIDSGYQNKVDNFFDTDASKEKIDRLTSIKNDYEKQSSKVSYDQAYGAAMRAGMGKDKAKEYAQSKVSNYLDGTGYSSIEDVQKDLTAETKRYNTESRLQEFNNLVYNAKNSADFDQMSEAGKNASGLTEFRNDSAKMAAYESALSNTQYGSIFGEDKRVKATKYMTDDEMKVYNYYLGIGDLESANRYLELSEETLNYRKAEEEFKEVEGKALTEIFNVGAKVGINQFATGITNVFNTEDQYINQNSTQMLSGMVREDLPMVGRVAYDTVTTTANMMPSILASSLISMIPGVGAVGGGIVAKTAGAGLMGASASGNAYQEMLNQGYSKEQSRTYATITGLSEALLQEAIGGVSALGGNVTGAPIKKFAEGLNNAAARFAVEVGGNMASEGLEEFLQDVLDPFFKAAVTGEDREPVDWSQAIYSGLLGALSAGMFEVPGQISRVSDIKSTYGQNQEELVLEGLDSAEGTRSRKVAEEYAKKLDSGKNLSGIELKNLVEANEEVITDELSAEYDATETDIQTALTDYGISERASKPILKEAKDYKLGAKAYLNGLNLAYEYGRTNQQSKLSDIVMTDSTKNLLFTVGKENTANANRSMAILKKNNPHVEIEKNVALNTLAPDVRAKAQASIAVAEAYGSASNVKFHAVQTVHKGNKLYAVIDGAEKEFSANGFFTRGNNVYFDVNAGDTFNGLGAYTIGHETGHFIAENNKEGFEKLSEAVIAQIDKMAELNPQKYQSFEKDLSDKLEQYKKLRDDGNKDYAGTDDELEAMAKEDVICDAISTFAADAETFKEFTDNIAKTDRSLWEKLKDVIGKMIARLESALKSFRNDDGSFVDADQNSARAIQNLVEDEYKKLRSLYATAFAEASNNYGISSSEEITPDLISQISRKLQDNEGEITAGGLVFKSTNTGGGYMSYSVTDKNGVTGTSSDSGDYNFGSIKNAYDDYSARNLVSKQNTGEVDIDGNESSHQFSLRSITEGAGLYFNYNEKTGEYTVLDRKGGKKVTSVTAEQIIDSPLGNIVTVAKDKHFITKAEAKKQYEFLADLLNLCLSKGGDFNMVWEIAGTQVFSAIKSNSDVQYGKTIDFSTVCKKTQQIINVISETQKRLKRGLTKDEIKNIVYGEVDKAGEPVPCPVCYVFSRWMGIGGILQQMYDFQSKYDGVEENTIREFMGSVEADIIARANTPNKKGNIKADFFDKNGNVKFGTVIADMKQKATSNKNSAKKALESNKKVRDQIDELKALIGSMTEKEAKKAQTKINNLQKKIKDETTINKNLANAEKALSRLEEYQWLTKTYMDEVKDADGNHLGWKMDKNFKPVDPDILFDLNKGAEFATKYPKSWKYRTTKGCNAGKAILPYSDARVGETIQGIAYSNVKDILVGDQNAFLNGDVDAQNKYIESAIKKQKAQNLIGGMRYQSTSDFRFEYGSDYLLTFLEMQAVGAKVQLYTKVIEAVDFLATMGADINMSVMPLDNGFITLDDGRRQLMFSSVTGINSEAAIAKSKQYDNAQLILVGISDEHIRLALGGDDVNGDVVTFVIPFHGSGNTTKVIKDLMGSLKEDLDVEKARDYSLVQSDHFMKKRTPQQKALWELRTKIISRTTTVEGKATKWDGVLTSSEKALLASEDGRFLNDLYNRFYVDKSSDEYDVSLSKDQAEHIFPYEYWDKSLTYDEADENGERFKQYCATMGIIPRFSGLDSDGKKLGYGDFTADKGYWKLLIDRKMYNNDGTYHEQQKINATNFKAETLSPSWAKDNYGEVMQSDTNPERTNAIVENVMAQLSKGERKMSERAIDDKEYMDSLDEKKRKLVIKNTEFDANNTVVGSGLKTLSATSSPNIARMGGVVGKNLGSNVKPWVYFHRDYLQDIFKVANLEPSVYSKAFDILKEQKPELAKKFNHLAYNATNNSIMFGYSPDFDTAREPIAGEQLQVFYDTGKTKYYQNNKQIFHHKWLWVKNDYKGFDIAEAWNWSKEYVQVIRPTPEIGGYGATKGVPDGTNIESWNKQLKRLGLPTESEEKKMYSLREVKPVVPSSGLWEAGHSEKWFLDNGYPLYQDTLTEEEKAELAKGSKGHGTQIAGTVKTYAQLFEKLKAENPSNWKNMRVLDASSGLGLGTVEGRNAGFNVTDIEPFPGKGYSPNYTDYSELEDLVKSGKVKPYDFIISNAVLNVIPQDTRDNLVSAMGNLLKDGGEMFINVINKTYDGAMKSTTEPQYKNGKPTGSVRTQEGDYSVGGNVKGRGHETFVYGSNSVQKVFSYEELVAYLQDALGKGYEVVPYKKLGMTAAWVKKTPKSLHSERNQVPTFYSKMSRVIDGIKTEKVGAGGVIPYLKGKGIKDEEIKWSGIEAFLDGKKSLTKAELQEFAKGSMLQIREKTIGELGSTQDSMYYAPNIDRHFNSFEQALEYARDEAEGYGVDRDSVKYEEDYGEYTFYYEDEYEDRETLLTLEEVDEYDMDENGDTTRWDQYKVDGGENYREMLFFMPNSNYTNRSMAQHWGAENTGVLAHARIQDFDTADGKMLFVEEIQSDWHNAKAKEENKKNTEIVQRSDHRGGYDYFLYDKKTGKAIVQVSKKEIQKNGIDGDVEAIHDYILESRKVPDAPFKTTYTDFVMKRLLRMAAEGGYDSIGWTTGKMQEERWSDEYAEGYRIEYDQDIPKFMKKYGKQWGATVEDVPLGKVNAEDFDTTYAYDYVMAQGIVDSRDDIETIDMNGDGTFTLEYYVDGMLEKKEIPIPSEGAATNIVHSMKITPEMKDSVLYEGQSLFSERATNKELANADDTAIYIKNTQKANYIGMILNGTKTVETRASRTLDDFIGKEIAITDGKYVYGYVTLGEPYKISAEDFHKKENQKKHRVPAGDEYDVKDGKSKWAYPIESYRKTEKKKLSDSKDYKYSFQAREMKFSERDSSGKQLSKAQAEYFKDSKVRDENGNLLVMYHGTGNGGFTIFDSDYGVSSSAFFFTKDRAVAAAYSGNDETVKTITSLKQLREEVKKGGDYKVRKDGDDFVIVEDGEEIVVGEDAQAVYNEWKDYSGWEGTSGIYETYLNVTNPLVIDAKNDNWDEIVVEWSDEPVTTNEIAEYAAENGYDGVIINNVIDTGLYGSKTLQLSPTTDVIVFDSNQIKNINNKKPTTDDDIRFSERDLSQDPRMLLSNALATTAQNDIERKYIEDYQSKIETINEEQKKLTEIRAELKELSFANGKRDTERIKQLSAEATKINNRINIYDKQLLKLESTKALKDVVEREKVKARKLAEQHSREAFQKYRERRSDIDIRHKIKGIAEDLTKMLKNPTERRFVPINFVQGVIDVVNSLDPTGRTYYKSGTSDVDVARTNEMYDPESKAAEKFRTAKEALINLKFQYDSLKNVDNYDFSSEFNEEFSSHISELIEAVGDTPIREMNYDQLSDVYDILSDIQFMIKYATKQIGKEDAISNYQMGQKIIEEMDEVRKNKLTTGKVGDIFREWTLNPMRAVREMTGYNEDSALYSLFADLDEGLRNADKFRMDTAKRFDALRDTKATKKVFDDAVQNASVEVIDTKNNKVKISKMQAMQAILTYEREIMNPNRRHLQSPVRFTDVDLDVKGKYSDAFDNGHDVYVDESFIKRVNDVLTDWDKQYLAAARKFFNEDSKQAVNEVSMKTKHRLVATEKAYIPYYVNQDYISKESENVKFDATIEGMGMLKSVKNNAPQQLVIRGLNTVIQDHADKVAKVYGLTIPVRNWNKAFNMKQTQKDGGDTVKVAIRNAWHDGGLKLLDQAVADLQSSRKRDKAALFSGAKSAFVTSTLAGNLSVWLKQAASYPTAGAVLSTSSLTKAFKYFGKNMKDTYAEIDAHTPEHWKRRIGLSTQELGDMNQSKGWQNKLNEKLGVASPMNWIQAMDVKTTAVLWEASKLEALKRGMKVGTEEYWNEVTKLYNKVIEDTQPMYDPLHRAEVTKNQLYSTFIMFQTQPLQNSGILREGAMKYKDYKNLYGKDSAEAKEAFGEFKKAVGSQMASHLTFTLFTLIGSMILHKMNRYRDDDDEVTAASLITEFTKQFGENFIGAILPIVGSYGISIAEKFIDGNRYDVISDPTVDKINTTIDNFVKLKKPSLGAFTNMATDIASYFGVPATNIMNIVNGARLHAEDIANGDFGSFEAGVDRSNKQDAHIMYSSYLAGDTAKMNRFKEDFIQEYLDKGKTEKEAKTQLRSTVTSNFKPLFLEAYNNKDTETMTKIRRFMNALNVYDDVVKTTQDWISKSK